MPRPTSNILSGTGPMDNYSATTNPVATDDITVGYSPGSVWANINTSQVFICGNATAGTATWKEVGATGTTNDPGGGTGDIQYNTGGAFGGSDNLFWDSTNNRLGIGTNTPANLLSVNGTMSSISYMIGSTSNWRWRIDTIYGLVTEELNGTTWVMRSSVV